MITCTCHPRSSEGWVDEDCPMHGREAEEARKRDRENCSGMCYRASDVGVYVPYDVVAYAHPDCPEHGDDA